MFLDDLPAQELTTDRQRELAKLTVQKIQNLHGVGAEHKLDVFFGTHNSTSRVEVCVDASIAVQPTGRIYSTLRERHLEPHELLRLQGLWEEDIQQQ